MLTSTELDSRPDFNAIEEKLFSDLIAMCEMESYTASIADIVRTQLISLPEESRVKIVSTTKDGFSPLFLACKKDNLELVEFLINKCKADVEQRGIITVTHYLPYKYRYCITHMPSVTHTHKVTPLWYAVHTGNFKVVQCLLEYGASIDSECSCGSTTVHLMKNEGGDTPFRSLTDNSDALSWFDYDGKTCLMTSVQTPYVCKLLLENGASVNAEDYRRNTALHHAIEKDQYDSVVLLLDHGANPKIKNDDGDDALQLACLTGCKKIFIYLIDNIDYEDVKILNSCELMGATLLVKDDVETALNFWETVFDKTGAILCPIEAAKSYFWQQLFDNTQTRIDANNIEDLLLDPASLHNQALRMIERILSPIHERFIGRLQYEGFNPSYTQSLEQHYTQILKRSHRLHDFRHYATELILHKDGILSDRACCLLRVFLWCCFHIGSGPGRQGCEINESVDFKEISTITEMVKDQLCISIELLKIQPTYQRQELIFDHMMTLLTYMIYVMVAKADNAEKLQKTRSVIKQIFLSNPRTSNGNSLLHLSVSRTNTFPLSDMVDDQIELFPSLKLVELFIECGADVNATNNESNSVLHVAAAAENFDMSIVKHLLRHGSHFDQRNKDGLQVQCLLLSYPELNLNIFDYVNLQCLAAQEVKRMNIPYEGLVSRKMEHFISMH